VLYFRDLGEINSMAKLKDLFIIWDPIVKFPEAGVKVEIPVSAETAPLLGNSRASSPSRFNRGAENLQQIRPIVDHVSCPRSR
jgi:hypothetical protein